MRDAFIFHGTGGYPDENWFPWLKKELESLSCRVHVPQFPTPENQTPETWFKVLKDYEQYLSEETIIAGHSLGGAFLLHVLQSIQTPIAGAFFIAAPIGIPPIINWAGDRPFTDKPFDWPIIRAHARHFSVFHSDNDPYVSLANGEELAKQLGVKLTLIPGAGHFNIAAGYLEFPALLEGIKKVL